MVALARYREGGGDLDPAGPDLLFLREAAQERVERAGREVPNAVVESLQRDEFSVDSTDLHQLSPLRYGHINLHTPEEVVADGEFVRQSVGLTSGDSEVSS